MNLDELRERLLALNEEAHQIKATAEAEKRDLTAEEAAKIDQLLDNSDRVAADIERLQRLGAQTERLSRPSGRKTKAAEPAGAAEAQQLGTSVELPGKPADLTYLGWQGTKNGGFRNLGEMAYHVAQHCIEGGLTDPRLERLGAATTYANEGAGADGGFAVPPEFRNQIMVKVLGEDSLLSLCDQVTCAGNTFTCPVDETTPWATSGGILANWEGEAATSTQSKPSLGERNVKLNKLKVLVPVTEEILEDASAMNAYLGRKAPDKIVFKVNAAIVAGSGVGQPQGLIGAPCKIQVAKESGQQANTIVGQNILKMWNRLYAPSRPTAVWLINQETEPQLMKLSMPGTDNTGNFVTGWGGFIWTPANVLTNGKFATLMGRPVIPTQACSALSAEGDIVLFDPQQYLCLLKSGPNPRVDTSIHLWFDQDLIAFRFLLRIGGVPWWSQAASPLNGSNTYSTVITLQAR